MGGDRLGRNSEITVITDANVLIDYVRTNKKILELMSDFFKEVMVPYDILVEVKELNRNDAMRFGLDIYYPDADTYYFASNTSNGLSFEDNICLYDAKNNGWSIVTSDKKMKKMCADEGIETFWGQEVMILMVKENYLSKTGAVKTAKSISTINSRIGRDILSDFIKILDS